MYLKEAEMYPQVIKWLDKHLRERFPKSKIAVYDTSQLILSKFLSDKALSEFFPDYLTFEIQIDIVGIILSRKKCSSVFVECKLNPITLKDVAQLLGYCRVARPSYALITSPKGFSYAVSLLIETYRRYDVLEFSKGKYIHIAKWSEERQEVDIASVSPPGMEFYF